MADELLTDDENEGNDLLAFYRSNLPILNNIMNIDIPPRVKKEVAIMLHATLIFDSDWKEFVYDMGVTDYIAIAGIEASAKLSKELPFYVALYGPLQHKSFGQIIQMFLEKDRRDILHRVRPFAEGVLQNINSLGGQTGASHHRTGSGHENCEEPARAAASGVVTDDNSFSKECSPAANCSSVAIDSDSLKSSCGVVECSLECDQRQRSEAIAPRNGMSSGSGGKEVAHFYAGNSEWKQKILPPSAPLADRAISVFIPHAESDTELARRLSWELRNERIVVKVLSEVDHFVMMNPSEALRVILQESWEGLGETDFSTCGYRGVLIHGNCSCLAIGKSSQGSWNDESWIDPDLVSFLSSN